MMSKITNSSLLFIAISKTIMGYSLASQNLRNLLKLTPALALCTALAWGEPVVLRPQSVELQAQTEWINAWVDDLKNSNQRWIQIDLSRQSLTAWEGGYPVYSVLVSTGDWEDPTPTGVFEIQSMHHIARMQGPGYDIPDVPFVMYYDGHYAIYGTYWHSSFGVPVSNGCTNVAINHAEWLFYWASLGTPVIVQE
jgi:lipoprotein-anchoring transpeptidase ErfK/SrfK